MPKMTCSHLSFPLLQKLNNRSKSQEVDAEDFNGLTREFSIELEIHKEDALEFTVKFLNSKVPHYSWVGIYMVKGEYLILRTFSGPKETEHTMIKIGDGICGLAAKEELTVIVPDVAKDSRYISCFPETKSELVSPIFKDGKVVGEIDIDSDFIDPFSNEDKHFLERIRNLIGMRL